LFWAFGPFTRWELENPFFPIDYFWFTVLGNSGKPVTLETSSFTKFVK
jgi:hypothetical protein